MDYIDKKINSYYSLYSTRILMVLSNKVNMQTYLNNLLMQIKNMGTEERNVILTEISKSFTLESYKYVGRKSIERRKKRNPNTKSATVVKSALSDEERARQMNCCMNIRIGMVLNRLQIILKSCLKMKK